MKILSVEMLVLRFCEIITSVVMVKINVEGSCENIEDNKRAIVFDYYVPNLERFVIIEYEQQEYVLSIEEKP
ncbi:hypothetical protein SAMN06297422_106108 [Lachnospiraceae bacterium]|nr:hypothetical protein SAMN06297422_106108 [Lachnospiraceae bacterium]